MGAWLKTLGIISIILVIIDIILMLVVFFSDADRLGRAIFGGLILFPFLVLVVGIWLVGFLLVYLKKKNNALGNIISWGGLTIFGVIFIISILGLFRLPPFDYWDIAGWFVWPFQLVIVIFFIIFTIIVNKK